MSTIRVLITKISIETLVCNVISGNAQKLIALTNICEAVHLVNSTFQFDNLLILIWDWYEYLRKHGYAISWRNWGKTPLYEHFNTRSTS